VFRYTFFVHVEDREN